MSSPLALKTAEKANHDVGVREVGNNDGPRVRAYQHTVGLSVGAPYCAAAVSTWIGEAAHDLGVVPQFVKSGSALGLVEHNQALVFHTLTPAALPCVAVYRHTDGIHGHALIAVGFDAETGRFQSIEANSNGRGSREGQGVYALDIRNVKDQALVAFVRIA